MSLPTSPVGRLSSCPGTRRYRACGRAPTGPCTTTTRGIPSEVVLEPAKDPIPRRSAVNLDALESVPIATLVERLGRLSDERMRQICHALGIAVACEGRRFVEPISP